MRLGRMIPLCLCAAFFAALPARGWAAPGNGSGAGATSAAPNAVPKIAVADRFYIFNKMHETAVLEDQYRTKQSQLLQQEAQKRDAITSLRASLKNMNPENQQYRDVTEQIENATAQLQASATVTHLALDRERKLMLKKLYEKIDAAIAKVAEQENIDLVLGDGAPNHVENIEELTFQEMIRMLNGRNVLYSKKQFNISEKVLTLLDAQYAAENKH